MPTSLGLTMLTGPNVSWWSWTSNKSPCNQANTLVHLLCHSLIRLVQIIYSFLSFPMIPWGSSLKYEWYHRVVPPWAYRYTHINSWLLQARTPHIHPAVKRWETSWAYLGKAASLAANNVLQKVAARTQRSWGMDVLAQNRELGSAPTPLYRALLFFLLHSTYHPSILCLLIVHHVVFPIACLFPLVHNLHVVKKLCFAHWWIPSF